MYTKRVTVIGKGGEDDKELIRFLSKHYLLKYVVADNFGSYLHNGSPVRENFFDANSDVVLLAPSLDEEAIGISEKLGHKLPIAHSGSYNGIFSTAGSKIIWKKYLPNDLVLSPKVHYVVGKEGDLVHSQELFRKIQLPVRIHSHGENGKIAKSFDEFHSAMHESMKKTGHAYVEDRLVGDLVHLITLPNFRNESLYKLPIMTKSGDGFVKANTATEEIKNKLVKIVEKLHQDLGLNHATQFDFVINKKGLHLLDIHTNPQKHSNSAFSHAMEYVGSSMPDFWRHVVERAREEFKKRVN